MSPDDAIVRPVRTKRTPKLGPLAVLAATTPDVELLRDRLNLPDSRALYSSRLHYNAADLKQPAIVGPLMGAPYAVMCLETLRAWGARKAFFIGWCGSIDAKVRIGDTIVPVGAWVDEGTSVHYGQPGKCAVRPDERLRSLLAERLQQSLRDFHSGTIWTTDAIFRETPDQILKFQELGALAVEMELSALLSAAEFYAFPLAGILTVSDELFAMQWQPGFKSDAFRQSRAAACLLVSEILKHQDIE